VRRTKAAYHRLAQPGQRVVLALPMNAALGGDGDIRSSAQGKASGRSGSGPARRPLTANGSLPSIVSRMRGYAFGSPRSTRGSGMNHMIATKTYKAQDSHALNSVRAIATT